ncbi:MAG: hypothetical protein PVF47_05965, partial [Anaerolineae bacterium]
TPEPGPTAAAATATAPREAQPAAARATATGEPGDTTAPSPTPQAAAPSPPPAASPPSAPASTGGTPALTLPSFLREFDLGIPAGNSYIPRSLAVHPDLGRIYARTRSQDDGEPGQVTVLDAASGQVVAIAPTGPDPYAEGDLALDPARNRLYATNPGDSSCSILDAASLEIVDTLQGVDRLAVDEAAGRLYAAGMGKLRLLDAADHTPLAEVAMGYAPRFLSLAAHPGQGLVYVAHGEQGLFRLDAYDAASLEMQFSVSLPGQPDDLVPDPHRDRLYLTFDDGEKTHLWTVGSTGRIIDDRELGAWTQEAYLALDPEGDRLFVGREIHNDQGVDVLDLETGQRVAKIPLRYTSYSLAWDRVTGRLLVSHTYANLIASADPETGQVTGLFATALDLVDLAVDPETGYLLATGSAGHLRVLDGESGEEQARLPGEGRISVDSRHGRVYTGGQGADRARIFERGSGGGTAPLQQVGEINTPARPVADPYHDSFYLVGGGIYPASLETLTITGVISDTLPDPAGFSPNPTAVDALVDPESGRILAVINNGVPGSNNGNYLYVYEAGTHRRIFSDTERSVAWLDVDPATGRAYVSRTRMGQGATSLLAGGREYVARVDALAGPLAVDPDLGLLYLSKVGYLGTDGSGQEGQLVLLDAANLEIVGSVSIPPGFRLLDLDPRRHLLYLGSQGGQVQIWSASGGQRATAAGLQAAPLPLDEVRAFYPAPGGSPLFAASLYRSDDGGQTWGRIDGGLPPTGVAQVVISPDWERDQTLFAVLVAGGESLGIWKSTDGGGTWRMANTGLSDLAVHHLAISPGFGRDGTLFATTTRQGLFRSTDGGETWQRLTDRYYQPEGYPDPPGAVFISPTYPRDRTLFVAHAGLWRSTDGGETWQLAFGSRPSSLALSPDFAEDGTLYGWFGAAGLLRSTDRGETWEAASRGLYLDGPGDGRLLIAREGEGTPHLYLHWQSSPPGQPAQYFRSADGGETWQTLAGDPPPAASQVRLSADGRAFLALDGEGRLVRWPVEELAWQPAGLPPLPAIDVYRLVLSPTFARDRVLYAVSPAAGVLRSDDAGLTWTDTGFPLRATHTEPTHLLVTPSGAVWAGSELGLYRAGDGTSWEQVSGGGLPPGLAVTTPELGAEGSLRLLAGDPTAARQIYLSLDGGETWTQPVPRLPHASLAEEILYSPAFATDQTAILATSWQPPQRTVGGGPWEPFGPPGEWILSALEMSPAFDRDGLLLLRLQDNRFWRATDGGQRWQEIEAPWGDEAPRGLDPGASFRLSAATFSPDYGRDGVLLLRAGNDIYRSTDAGATWQQVLAIGPALIRAVFSPGYAGDGQIYLLQGNSVYHSADRGEDWQPLPTAPWGEFDEMRIVLSPTFPRDDTLLAWNIQGRVYLSTDGGRSWREASAGLAVPGLRQVHFSPDHAGDGLIYALPHAGGLYKWTGAGYWLLVTERAPEITPTPRPAPSATPAVQAPPACATEPARFGAVWQQAGARLGCPLEPAAQVQLAEQRFEKGRMIWDSSQQEIVVLLDSGTWQAFADTWDPDTDPDYDPQLPPPPRQPQRGFGKVWREQLGGPGAAIGWAVENERPVAGWRQPFARGLLFWTDATAPGATTPGTAYLLYQDSTWQAVAAP